MRSLFRFLLFLLPLAGFSQTTNIVSDKAWHDGNVSWCDRGWSTTAINYKGTIYVFNIQKEKNNLAYFPFIYTLNLSHNDAAMAAYKVGSKNYIDYFGYPHEQELGNYPTFLGRNFAFRFNGRLWYYQHIQRSTDCQSPCNESYECFAQLPVDPAYLCYTYYIDNTKLPDVYKQGAFQLDSLIYFVGMNRNSSSPDYNKWVIQEFRFDDNLKQFVKLRDLYSTFIFGTTVGGIIRKVDSKGAEYLILNTYTVGSTGSTGLFKLVPALGTDGKRTFNISFYSTAAYANVQASTIIEGSIKGGKSTDSHPTQSDRFTLFATNSTTSSDGTHHISYIEFYTSETGDDYLGNMGELSFPSASPPGKAGDYYHLVGVNELVPLDASQALDGYDSFQQYNWLLYPDKDAHFNGAKFKSDLWTFDDDPSKIVTSEDLTDENYEGIRGTWSLTGIVEGGPPVSVNWPRWDSIHNKLTHASVLSFETSTTQLTDLTTSTEDAWSLGESMDMSTKTMKRLSGSLSEEFKYSETYKSTIQNGFSLTKKEGVDFELFEDNQEYGKFIWRIPKLRRYTYKCYPWWDTKPYKYPVNYSTQYLIRAFGYATVYEAIPLEEEPFKVNNPNDPSMAGWSQPARDVIVSNAIAHGMSPAMELDWTTLTGGNFDELDVSVDHTSAFENTKTYEATATIGVTGKVPKVFEMSLSGTGTYEVNYTTESSVSTEFEQSIRGSLEELGSTEDGLHISELHMDVYWFRPETDSAWWFYQDLGGDRPWYMAYLVTGVKPGIKLIAPGNGAAVEKSALLFSWEPENPALRDFTLFISTSPNIASDHTVYRKPAGQVTSAIAEGFAPLPGTPYFWAVRAFTSDGRIAWSKPNLFTLRDQPADDAPGLLKTLVHPNPGKAEELRIVVVPDADGEVSVSVMNLAGDEICRSVQNGLKSAAEIFRFNSGKLPAGFYIAIIRSGDKKAVQKIVIR